MAHASARQQGLLLLVLAICAGAGPATRPAETEIPVNPLQEAQLRAAAGPKFQIKRTSHFMVAYDSTPDIVNDFTARIEHTYAAIYRFCDLNGIEAHRPTQRLEAIFFNDRETYDRYGKMIGFPSEGTFGVYHQGTNRSAFFNVLNNPSLLELQASIAESRQSLNRLSRALSRIRDRTARVQVELRGGRVLTLTRNEAAREIDKARRELRSLEIRRTNYFDLINRTVVQHEVAHQVLFNAGVHVRGGGNPKWLVEGMACLFEPLPDALGSGINTINQLRLRDFRRSISKERQGGRLTGADLLEAIESDRVIDPAELVSTPELFNEREDRGTTVYATTWALAHYLHRTRLESFVAYLREVAARPPGVPVSSEQERALFARHFGKPDAAFIMRWGDYILRLPYRPPD